MLPSFSFNIEQTIQGNLVSCGKCKLICSQTTYVSYFYYVVVDGQNPSLVFGVTGGKVLVHSPHEHNSADNALPSVRFLNFNKNITAIAAGKC